MPGDILDKTDYYTHLKETFEARSRTSDVRGVSGIQHPGGGGFQAITSESSDI